MSLPIHCKHSIRTKEIIVTKERGHVADSFCLKKTVFARKSYFLLAMYVFCYRGTDLEYIAFQYSESLINWSSKKCMTQGKTFFIQNFFTTNVQYFFYLRWRYLYLWPESFAEALSGSGVGNVRSVSNIRPVGSVSPVGIVSSMGIVRPVGKIWPTNCINEAYEHILSVTNSSLKIN